jgi:hypothetical protein
MSLGSELRRATGVRKLESLGVLIYGHVFFYLAILVPRQDLVRRKD